MLSAEVMNSEAFEWRVSWAMPSSALRAKNLDRIGSRGDASLAPGYYMSRLLREDAGTMPALPALTSVKRRTRAFALPVTPDCFLAGSPTRATTILNSLCAVYSVTAIHAKPASAALSCCQGSLLRLLAVFPDQAAIETRARIAS